MKKTSAFVLLLMLVTNLQAQNNFFTDIKESKLKNVTRRIIIPDKYRTLSLDTVSVMQLLKKAPQENELAARKTAPIIALPLPNGTISRFRIWETPIMAPELAAKFPQIKTYTGQGIDDRYATVKIDWTNQGLHAVIASVITHTVFISPYAFGNKTAYLSCYASDLRSEGSIYSDAILKAPSLLQSRPADEWVTSIPCIGSQLHTYRIAIACTGEYAQKVTNNSTPSVSDVLSVITSVINTVNGIYEKELSIRFVFAANENSIIYTNPNTDPFPTGASQQTIVDNGQTAITNNIGNGNYDVGQTFSTEIHGGASAEGIVCVDNTKAYSTTGLANPVGDRFAIDYVAHEIGHEFYAHHTFNSSLGGCSQPGQFSATTNSEPGSGSTIMCYASGNSSTNIICSTDNLQTTTDPYFNAVNFDEIEAYSMFGSSCYTSTATGNTPPVVNAVANYTIPRSTPFVLTGSATDVDGDALTYCWEQMDVGGPEGTWNHPSGDAPIFRSFLPDTTPTRYFPKLSDVINNTTTIGEIMPSYTRVLHFRLTARDNKAGGGGVCNTKNSVTVDGNSGPFTVTYPNATGITWLGGATKTVTWNTMNTQAAPVNCSNVTIQLSTDGGNSYPVTLVSSTSNSGTAQVQMPLGITSNTARLRVMAVGNIFYDISDNNFTIQDTSVPIMWLSFTATAANNQVLLSWMVNEVNVDHYEVERKTAVSDSFFVIGQKASVTGNGIDQSYSFIDPNPVEGANTYIIKEIGKNGNVVYSEIRALTFTNITSAWSIPTYVTAGSITLRSNSTVTNVVIQLYDVIGRLVKQTSPQSVTAGQSISLDNLNRFSQGVYTVKISGSTGVFAQKILNQ
ncbi:reprolysin-like metallopeptidase [Ferruginibacter albus]|uniref:reprolysin-like metallopeptidase n=1 Tax=Ferruginibacter albus TaxID=2875540 RepID=UPI001CC697A0|nr:zinc-dependent metalloprotease family protein [Ferruginibacter albus]UAY51182.1 T9SS type A sorting domain-containing protein [Ferruginibacter albus]